MTAAVVSLQERIAQSRKAKAVERAWQVAKTLEGDRSQIEGLRWIAPENDPQAGIRRTVDFAYEFPEGVTFLYPTPMDISVVAPAKVLVPNEGMDFYWTMPLLSRMSPAPETLDTRVGNELGRPGKPSLRNRIDLVSFLPFAKQGAPPEEQFSPEFYVSLAIRAPLGDADNYFGAIALYNGRPIKQMVNGSDHAHLEILADPYHATLFKAEMLVSLQPEELATTAANAGELEIFVYRMAQHPATMKLDVAKLFTLGTLGLGGDGETGSRSLSFGGSDLTRSMSRGLSLTGLSPSYQPPVAPAQAPKEVGDVRLGEGTKGDAVGYTKLEGYQVDESFGIQPIRIRFLGVREQSEQQAREALKDMSARYS
ncbi:MAG: hypothetical protein Q7R76_01630 [Candidatus Woesearchaeota archaeon]|nr:hypothetical protein [Candidatus Woesearchaeota archaeon]